MKGIVNNIFMKLQPRTLLFIAGALWFAVGLWLLKLGINFLIDATNADPSPAFLAWFKSLSGEAEKGVLFLLVLALIIGFFKGRFVLSKTVNKTSERLTHANSITALFTPKYLILLGVMMGIGLSIRFLGVPLDIRGFVDVAVGSALVNGAMLYFRKAISLKTA
jgi:hypothetical protein